MLAASAESRSDCYALGSALENYDEEGIALDPRFGENDTFYLQAMATLPTVQNAVEIENYLLVPSVLQRVLHTHCDKTTELKGFADMDTIEKILSDITEEFHFDALGQYVAKAIERSKGAKINPATITSAVSMSFEKKWATLSERLCIVPGKEALRRFRQVVQEKTGLTLTDAVVVGAFRADEISPDLVHLLETLSGFTQ